MDLIKIITFLFKTILFNQIYLTISIAMFTERYFTQITVALFFCAILIIFIPSDDFIWRAHKWSRIISFDNHALNLHQSNPIL